MNDNQRLRVLVVDDDEVDRTAVRRLLRRSDQAFELSEAPSTADARCHLATDTTDVILLDHQMPSEDGLDFLRSLADPYDHPPVVMLTGLGDATLAVAALKAGAADYLVKGDIPPERLTTTLSNAITARRSELGRRAASQALEDSHRRSRASLACTQSLLLDIAPTRTLERALRDLLRGLDADRLCLLRSERCDASPGWRLDAQAHATEIDPSETIPQRAAWRPAWHRWQAATATGEILLVDTATAPEPERRELEAQGARTSVAVPFYLHGRWAGVLRCDRLRSDRGFDREDARFLQSAGDILTVWLEQRDTPS